MEPERIKELLRIAAEAMERAQSFSVFEEAQAQYKALKNLWNRKTGNALIFFDLSKDNS